MAWKRIQLQSSATCHRIAEIQIRREVARSKGSGRWPRLHTIEIEFSLVEIVSGVEWSALLFNVCDSTSFMQTVSCKVRTLQRREEKYNTSLTYKGTKWQFASILWRWSMPYLAVQLSALPSYSTSRTVCGLQFSSIQLNSIWYSSVLHISALSLLYSDAESSHMVRWMEIWTEGMQGERETARCMIDWYCIYCIHYTSTGRIG